MRMSEEMFYEEEETVDLDPNAKYPEVVVQLVGEDGNAFAIIGRARKAMRKKNLTSEQISEFVDEATAGDYNHVLATCMKYFTVL
jgi:hypothetical protein